MQTVSSLQITAVVEISIANNTSEELLEVSFETAIRVYTVLCVTYGHVRQSKSIPKIHVII